jgi:hypothetical protein
MAPPLINLSKFLTAEKTSQEIETFLIVYAAEAIVKFRLPIEFDNHIVDLELLSTNITHIINRLRHQCPHFTFNGSNLKFLSLRTAIFLYFVET